MKKYSMFYTMLSMLSLLMVLASCNPNTNKSTDTLSVAESKEVKSTQYSRTKRQVDSEPQDTTNAHSNVLTIQFSIPEENTEGQPTTWSEKNSSYQIFYFPIASNNLSQNNLETIKSKLSLGEWIRNLPLHTQYPILHYYKEGSHPKDYTCYPIKARLDETWRKSWEGYLCLE